MKFSEKAQATHMLKILNLEELKSPLLNLKKNPLYVHY
jgi:hypothetical protein